MITITHYPNGEGRIEPGGLTSKEFWYAAGFDPPHYPVPAIPLQCDLGLGYVAVWQSDQRKPVWFYDAWFNGTIDDFI